MVLKKKLVMTHRQAAQKCISFENALSRHWREYSQWYSRLYGLVQARTQRSTI